MVILWGNNEKGVRPSDYFGIVGIFTLRVVAISVKNKINRINKSRMDAFHAVSDLFH